jgi:hypothetical protein
MEAITYAHNWALITSLWSEWNPNDHAASVYLDNLSGLDQHLLHRAVRQHKAEELGQYKEPKLFRLMQLCDQFKPKPVPVDRTSWKVQGPTTEEIEEWKRWAEDVLADVTEDELAEARKVCASWQSPRLLAIVVDHVRSKRKVGAL